jgi:hypothetical protein
MPVANVIEWMQNFNAKGSKSLNYADYPDVWPSGGLRYVHPAVAERQLHLFRNRFRKA